MKDCHTIAPRGKEGKKVSPSFPSNDVANKNRFYALRARGSKTDDDEDVGKLSFLYFSSYQLCHASNPIKMDTHLMPKRPMRTNFSPLLTMHITIKDVMSSHRTQQYQPA